jgi:hypothetical protein
MGRLEFNYHDKVPPLAFILYEGEIAVLVLVTRGLLPRNQTCTTPCVNMNLKEILQSAGAPSFYLERRIWPYVLKRERCSRIFNDIAIERVVCAY